MDDNPLPAVLAPVASYYAEKLSRHGTTSNGVDWNSPEGHALRFEQLCKVITGKTSFSINDLGCGYGALWDYLHLHHADFSYHGIDVAPEMITAAKARHSSIPKAVFTVASKPEQVADYTLASGIFNVRLKAQEQDWIDYIHKTLGYLHEFSSKGFAFNCLTSYSDADHMRPDLYYADPCVLFDHCKRRYSSQIALLHDYGLYEFTILVRKEPK